MGVWQGEADITRLERSRASTLATLHALDFISCTGAVGGLPPGAGALRQSIASNLTSVFGPRLLILDGPVEILDGFWVAAPTLSCDSRSITASLRLTQRITVSLLRLLLRLTQRITVWLCAPREWSWASMLRC
jgi:hypothetical protein